MRSRNHRRERVREREERRSEGRAPEPDPELRDLLREALEALEDRDLPSGDWCRAEETPGSSAVLPADPLARLLAGGAAPPAAGGELDPDAESALWLLVPPRGNA